MFGMNYPTFIRRGVTRSGIPYTVVCYPDGEIVRFRCEEAIRQRVTGDRADVNRARLAHLPLQRDLRQSERPYTTVDRRWKASLVLLKNEPHQAGS